jgi:hypothetical protein
MEPATLTNTVTNDTVYVQFNPEEYTLNQDNNFAQVTIPGLQGPLLQFANGNLRTMDMELFFDSYESHDRKPPGDVRDLTAGVTDLMNIDPTIHAPPVLIFAWGSISFRCVLARASTRYVLFRPDGIPVRARMQVTFNEFINKELEAKSIKRETADYSQRHLVGEGESLSSIAHKYYQDPSLWRPIAINNNIDNPADLSVGQALLVPQLPFRDPESGEVMA